MDEVKISIVIPSHLRAKNVMTTGAVDNAIICVPDNQVDEYKEYNIDSEIIGHPNSIKGITMKRQWIYDHFKNVFMIDDDVFGVNRLYTEAGETSKLNPREVYSVIQWVGNIAKLMGCYIFGFNKNGNPAQYQELKPFQMSGFVNAGAFGLLEGSKLKYDPEITVAEDYQISCENALHHRKCYIDGRFSVTWKNTFMNRGGLSEYRTKSTEKKDTLYLRKMYGEVIDLKKDTVQAKRKHEYMRTMKIPF